MERVVYLVMKPVRMKAIGKVDLCDSIINV